MKESRIVSEALGTPVPRNELRVDREAVRILHVRTGVRAGRGRAMGGNQGNGVTVQIAGLW